ncbi:ATP-binding cassette, subfamily C [Paracoccus halophilus]|uniref:ATP-binding cassette, subfamily C n=1 Tax=Paracoccus halophilus TaxID=376733 RepID=A0A1I0SXD3_9RHOB|nr:ATP-binding cassette domain-containing protein [Paracoccus halophilus]SFA44132.1 ATP-binding cassette, subfamily C [Paracoccus halophilus]
MAKRRKAGTETSLAAAWRISRPGLAAVMIFTACFNLLKFAMPLYLIQALDRVPASRSIETLVMLTIMVVIATACGMVLDVLRRRMLVRWGVWIERRFGPPMVDRGLADSRLADQTAEISSSLGYVEKLRGFVSGPMVSWLDLFFAPLFFLGIFLIHPLLGVIGLASLVLLAVVGVLSDTLTRDARRASGDAYREQSELVQAAGQNKESVGAFSMARTLTERWRRTASARLDEKQQVEDRHILFKTLRRGIGQFLRIAMIAVGVWLVVIGSLTFGGIFAARIMAGFGYSLANDAISNYRNLRETRNAYAAVKKRLADEPAAEASAQVGVTAAPLIIDQMSYRYPGERSYLFNRLSLQIAPGELLVVNGTAGTGKTTLSRLLVGVLEPREGQIRLGDVEIARLPAQIRSGLVGYLPQHTELFTGTLRENIARMGEGDFDHVVDAARMVGFHDRIIQMSDGYDTLIDGTSFGMSGSERKRIALARAFYGRPRILVLDEPSANLDSASRRLMENALAELKRGGASIVVTQSIHSAQIARMADRFLVLGGKRSHEVTENTGRETLIRARDHLRSVT